MYTPVCKTRKGEGEVALGLPCPLSVFVETKGVLTAVFLGDLNVSFFFFFGKSLTSQLIH